jgi:hypothetical protein
MDRRRHPRVPYGAWVEDLTHEGTIQFFLSENLSIGGLLLIAEKPPAIGNQIHLRMVVENEARVMSVDGKVIRHTPMDNGYTSFAVTFINLDDSRRIFIEELIEECTKQGGLASLDPTPIK